MTDAGAIRFVPADGVQGNCGCKVLSLPSEDIHVWGFALEGSAVTVAACRAWLDRDELNRIDRALRWEDRNHAVLVRGCVRAVLARYVGFHPSALQLRAGAAGKPELMLPANAKVPVRFNLSHSHERLLIAVAAAHEVGVDLEWMGRQTSVTKLARRFFAPGEADDVCSRIGVEQSRQFYRYWVAKEAWLKCVGVGLRASLAGCQVELGSIESRAAAVRWQAGSDPVQSGRVCFLDVGTDWMGAVSASGTGWQVIAKQWEKRNP